MTKSDKVEAKVTHRFMASPEQVFDAWLDPEIISAWMAKDVPGKGIGKVKRVEVDPRVGGGFVFSDMRAQGEAVHWGSYREIHRPHKLVFTWITSAEEQDDPSIVTLVILPHPDAGTAVTLTHEMNAKWADYVGRTEMGWGTMLGQIEMLLDKGPER
jgi:uncharacterized protein YndB with AHSA1/START domain